MVLINDYFLQSQLALAAYANLTSTVPNESELIKNGMTTVQASVFASNWTVVDQYNSITGLSATVFQNNATGERYLAIRGTQGVTDFLADYLILNGTPAELNPQYQALKSQVQVWLDNGTLSSGFTVSGHSLGGYLAAGLVADFGDAVSHAYLYNAPGNNSTISVIAQALGWAEVPDSTKITSLQADAGISIIAGLGHDFSTPITIAIENQFLGGVTNPPLAMNHSQQVLTDSLALYQAFALLDPNLTATGIGDILKKATDQNALTLEKALDALRTITLGQAAVEAHPTTEGNREEFFTNLYALQTTANFTNLTNQITLSTSLPTVTEARADFGAFLSLIYLTPFTLKAATLEAQNLLKNTHASLGYQWDADNALTAEQRANGEASYSDFYLADRAAMLSWQNKLNAEDFVDSGFGYLTAAKSAYFEDKATGTVIQLNKLAGDKRYFIFGSDAESDMINGGDYNDHLYGGGGDDTLDGGNGNDWLEGGAGNDTLRGGLGIDKLFGGYGDDVLEGGDGDDELKGGAGNDTYLVGKGHDVVLDTDGQGVLNYNQVVLTGGKGDGVSLWRSDDNNYTYTLIEGSLGTEGTLIIRGPAPDFSSVTIQHFKNGDLGIQLEGENKPAEPPETSREIRGDLAPKDTNETLSGVQIGYDEFGNIITDPNAPSPDRSDTLYGSADDDYISGGGGSDTLKDERGGDDYMDGGEGNDTIRGGEGHDFLVGGTGQDSLYGEAGDDWLFSNQIIALSDAIVQNASQQASGVYGGTLNGGEGNDVLIGDADTDTLIGGFGDDVIAAGGGDDSIYGDKGGQTNDADGNDVLYGQAGNDYLYGGGGHDFLDGGEGDDRIYGNAGSDTLLGGDGEDELYGGADADRLYGGYGGDDLYGESGSDILIGGEGDDRLYGDATDSTPEDGDNDELYGDAGNDWLYGYVGSDILYGGDGNDTLYGDAYNSTPEDGGNDELYGEAGNDYLFGYAGSDILSGGHGNDHMEGGVGNDALYGDDGDDRIYGGGGEDRLFGGEGDDRLYSYEGETTYLEGENDFLEGGSGNDYLEAGQGNDVLSGGDGDDYLYGGDGSDFLDAGDGDDDLNGGSGDDHLDGGTGNNLLVGGEGNDILISYEGADLLFGDDGDDFIDAGAGNDWIDGGIGSDTLVGGAGNDRYIVDRDSDIIVEYDNEGYDKVSSTVSYVLAANLEDLSLIGSGSMDATGNALNNILTGNTWENILIGGAGDDTLNGREGDDLLNGGDGNDYYWFKKGDGYDLIVESSGHDRVVFTRTHDISTLIRSSDITATRSNGEVTLTLTTGDSIRFADYGNGSYAIEEFEFLEDGVFGADWLNALLGIGLSVSGVDAAATYTEDQPLNLAPMVISGSGNVEVTLALSDSSAGALNTGIYGSAASSFDAGSGVWNASGAVADVNALLAALVFTPAANYHGDLSVSVSVSDGVLPDITGSWMFSGVAVNDAPFNSAAPATLADGLEDTPYVIHLASLLEGYSDVDGDLLNVADLTATNGTLSAFDDANQSWTFTPDADFNGAVTLTYRVTDGITGIAVSQSFTLIAANDAPTIALLPSIEYVDTIADDVFPEFAGTVSAADADGDVLTYGIVGGIDDGVLVNKTGSFGILTVSKADGAYTYTPDAGAIEALKSNASELFEISVTDPAGASVATALIIKLSGADDATGFSGELAGSVAEDVQFVATGTLQVQDRDAGDAAIVAQTGTSGIYGDFSIESDGHWVYTLRNNDANVQALKAGESVSETFTVMTAGGVSAQVSVVIAGNNDAPVPMQPALYETATEAALFSYTLPAGIFADIDNGDVLSYSASLADGSVLPEWLSFDPVARELSGTPAIEDVGRLQVKITATDLAGAEAQTMLTLSIASSIPRYTGTSGNDTIAGTTGAEQMFGLAGDDTYTVNHEGDLVVESADEGTDKVNSSISYVLTEHVENLTLTGSALINGTGNALDNVLVGNWAFNRLSGEAGNDTLDGGAGNDVLRGGTGDDTYIVDLTSTGALQDTVTEYANEGNDTVKLRGRYAKTSYVTLALAANLENLDAGATSSSRLNLSGNELDNRLTGNYAANTLTGNAGNDTLDGGAGVDKLIGGAGNDTYIVDMTSAGKLQDTVTENAGQGTDTLQLRGSSSNTSYVTITLAANLENLDASATGSSKLNFTGNTADNLLVGNSAANWLNGNAGNDILIGGVGNDMLIGGTGSDTYVFKPLDATANGGLGLDTILSGGFVTDLDGIFEANEDILDLTGFFAPDTVNAGNISEYLRMSGSTLQIDRDGGGNSFVNLVNMTGTSITTNHLDELLTAGQIIA